MNKSRILLLVCLVLLVITFLLIDNNRNLGSYEVKLVDNLEDDYQDMKICLLNNQEKLEVVSVKVENKSNLNEVDLLIKLFDEFRNSLPLEYKTTLFENINVKSLKKVNDTLYLEIEKIGEKTNLDLFLTALMWSYKYLGIKQIELKIGKKKYVLDENMKINPVVLATIPKKVQTYYELTDNGFIPYTIYHSDEDIDILLTMANVSKTLVNYEINNNDLVINFLEEIEKEKLEVIKYNLCNLDYSNISIFIKGKLCSD